MPALSDLMSLDLLQKMIDERMISIQKHPDDFLWILNYSAAAQYTRTWNEATKQCRGLIIDSDDFERAEVVARPFPKFMNVGEHAEDNAHGALPSRPFEVFEKMDGSLGILYEAIDGPAIATRGSFASDQAIWATEFFRKNYDSFELPADQTLLFEIIYPQNRIVVDYGSAERLVLLARIDNETGADLSIDGSLHPFEVVRRYSITELREVMAMMSTLGPNDEGFVLRFEPETPDTPSLRAKAKGDEYVRLHRIVTGVSSKTIWEYLSTGKPLDELLDRVPDEFYQWVRKTADDLLAQFRAKIISAQNEFNNSPTYLERKELAALWQSSPNRALLFLMLDGKMVDAVVWRQLKPVTERPFRVDVDS